jgi:hypothetical protein
VLLPPAGQQLDKAQRRAVRLFLLKVTVSPEHARLFVSTQYPILCEMQEGGAAEELAEALCIMVGLQAP